MSSTVPERAASSASTTRTSARAFPWLPPSWVLIVALVAVAANLRPAIAGVPPLVPQIEAELHLSNAWLGVLTLLPVLCMGVFAPLAHWASTIWGSAPVVMAATVLLTIGSAMRLGGSNVLVLYTATLVVGIGIAVVGTLLPRLVKTLFPPERVGLITGVYMLAIMLGATIGAGLSEPLATALGSWEESLAAWSLLGVVGLVAWAPLALVVWRHRAEATAQSDRLRPSLAQPDRLAHRRIPRHPVVRLLLDPRLDGALLRQAGLGGGRRGVPAVGVHRGPDRRRAADAGRQRPGPRPARCC